MNAGDFVKELQRRKVVRLALIYVIVGWAVIEAADTILPNLDVPAWAVSLVIVLVLLGFPVAMVLSWMFDLSHGGVKRTTTDEGTASEALQGASSTGGRDAAPSGPPEGGTRLIDRPPAGIPTVDPPRARRGPPVPSEKSIAVLPFVNMSDDRDNEYFSDGMTEEILNALAKVKQLQVASRTSCFAFKGHESDVLEIAEKLRVATVVEGSVRKADNRIRVTAQLISAEDGYHLWSETYDRELEDVFRVQDEIARSIVDALRVELMGEEEQRPLVEQETQDMEAYNLYLKGRFFHTRDNEDDLLRSLTLYRDALNHDPTFARAYAGMADTWMQLADDWIPPEKAYPEAKAAAAKAVELDDSLAEAHTAIGKVLGWFEWDFDGAELALRRAVAANPRYADAHWGLGSILPPNGQLPEAVEEMRIALSLDPLSPVFSYWLARFLFFSRDFEAALAEADRAIELDPNAFRPRIVLGQCHLLQGRGDEALEIFRTAHDVSGVVSAHAFIARALVDVGRNTEARALLEELASGEDYVRSEFLAPAWAALGDLGDLDRAFAALDEAYADHSAGLIYLHVDPSYGPLRSDPRFGAMMDRIGLRETPTV